MRETQRQMKMEWRAEKNKESGVRETKEKRREGNEGDRKYTEETQKHTHKKSKNRWMK